MEKTIWRMYETTCEVWQPKQLYSSSTSNKLVVYKSYRQHIMIDRFPTMSKLQNTKDFNFYILNTLIDLLTFNKN